MVVSAEKVSSSKRGDWAEGVKEKPGIAGLPARVSVYCGQGVHQDRSSL